jgi:Cu(I)/Ag(I) efflux system protein CusF
MKMKRWMLLGLLLLSIPAWAAEWVEGEVRRVDAANAKVTVKHGAIKDLKMPPMTMVFSLKDPEWVKLLKPGQAIRFQAKDLGGGKLQIEALEPKAP